MNLHRVSMERAAEAHASYPQSVNLLAAAVTACAIYKGDLPSSDSLSITCWARTHIVIAALEYHGYEPPGMVVEGTRIIRAVEVMNAR